mmetsp:Transcript_38536/g.110636  ORF Transcript_38536/g.110636 Transcript_38536/m.110636 type:complete len:207 (-) Transcript_38536:1036-1656(-)
MPWEVVNATWRGALAVAVAAAAARPSTWCASALKPACMARNSAVHRCMLRLCSLRSVARSIDFAGPRNFKQPCTNSSASISFDPFSSKSLKSVKASEESMSNNTKNPLAMSSVMWASNSSMVMLPSFDASILWNISLNCCLIFAMFVCLCSNKFLTRSSRSWFAPSMALWQNTPVMTLSIAKKVTEIKNKKTKLQPQWITPIGRDT